MSPASGDSRPQNESALAPVEPIRDIPPPQTPDNRNGRLVAASKTVMQFSGPMPHPELLGRYEALCPGSANRIIKMAEQEAEHRRAAETKIIDAQIKDRSDQYTESRCGQICALVITLAALGLGAYTAAQGHEWAGSVIGVGGIGGIVTTFIFGRQREADNTAKPQTPPNPSATSRKRKK